MSKHNCENAQIVIPKALASNHKCENTRNAMPKCSMSKHKCDNAQIVTAGRLAQFIAKWREITTDNWVLNTVQHYFIEFVKCPSQHTIPREISFSQNETKIILEEINKMLLKKAIVETPHKDGEFLSNLFIRPKKDGTYRPIINLRGLNTFVAYSHFKMETIHSAMQLISSNCFMASIDLRDAYYAIPIAQEHRKYLRFLWLNKVYEFTCLPFGLSCAPRVFTKVMKPLVASLRRMGHVSCDYIDDSLLIGSTHDECMANIIARTRLTEDLGFTIHKQKSVLKPAHEITFLGFILNSVQMTVSIPPSKAVKIVKAISKLIDTSSPKIRDVARIIGSLVCCELAVPYGAIFRRTIETEKNAALTAGGGNFDARMVLSKDAISDLNWWISNMPISVAPMHRKMPDCTIETDASNLGWGAHYDNQTIGGQWSNAESVNHINFLELKACFLALQSFFTNTRDIHVHIKSDNVTAVAYLQHSGGTHSPLLNDLTRESWRWCMTHNIWLSSSHLPGSKNTIADFASRNFHEDLEWKLNSTVFQEITQIFLKPEVDLFASRLNFQLEPYVSWHPEPGASHVDAFTLNWSRSKFYAFPPFCLIDKVLTKICYDKAIGILIVPLWHTQTWFPRLLKLLVREPVILPNKPDLLTLPSSDRLHPLRDRLRLTACVLSGRHCDCKAFQDSLPKSSLRPGEILPGNVTGPH